MSIPDYYRFTAPRDAAPATDAAAVTPSDSTPLPGGNARFLYVGGSGSVVVVTAGGTQVTLSNAVAGSTIPLEVTQVMATGTTATGLVAFY